MTALRFLSIPLLLVSSIVHGQSLRGRVLESGTDAPIGGASVEVYLGDDLLTSVRTDSTGAFLLFPRIAGNLRLRVIHPSYVALDVPELRTRAGEIVSLELRLSGTVIPLEPVIVTARVESRLAGFRERAARGVPGRFISREQIDARPGARATDLLREVPSVEVLTIGRGGTDTPTAPGTPDVTNPRVAIITMRGQGTQTSCRPTVYVDGQRLEQTDESGVDQFLRPEMIEGVEIYSFGDAPVEFVDPSSCGVVAFWSRASLEGRGWSWTRAGYGLLGFLVAVALTR